MKRGDRFPCCHCGSCDNGVVVLGEGGFPQGVPIFCIRCSQCGALGPPSITVRGAEDFWNTRNQRFYEVSKNGNSNSKD